MKLHLFQYTSETAAANDAAMAGYRYAGNPMDGVPPGWDTEVCFPNESVYLSAVLQSGFWIIVASPDTNTALAQNANCKLAWDNISAVILGGTWTGNNMAQVYVSPVPAGAYNPWSGPAPS